MPVVAKSVVDKWSAMSVSGDIEIQVSKWFKNLREDITRTAFGCSYEDGKAVFGLQAQQMMLAAYVFQKVFTPSYRYNYISSLTNHDLIKGHDVLLTYQYHVIIN